MFQEFGVQAEFFLFSSFEY